MTGLLITSKKAYVQLMLEIIASGLVSASHNDPVVKQELAGFKTGQNIQMLVMPDVAQFTVQVNEDKTLKIVPKPSSRPDLSIKFKHVSLAFLVFSFQESTSVAFARDRMIADGNLSDSIRFVRCLNRLESMILPKMIAKHAVKKYPEDVSLTQKISLGGKIYAGLAKNLILR